MNNTKLRMLICDDDKYFRMALKEIIAPFGLIEEAATEAEALELLKDQHFDLALIDMEIDGPLSGINILKASKSKKIHSIILSSLSDDEVIEEAYLNNCDHFLAKSQYRTYLEPYILKQKRSLVHDELAEFFNEKYITKDKDLKEKIQQICKINLKNQTVLITGETGVGKSLIGELLHQQTYDKSHPFVHINCSELSETLLESELFGHEKGSFTGADSKKIGKLELANGGTLFLDEIGTMPLSMQQKLLKVLDQKTFYPIGASKPSRTDFTLISATCDDLIDKIMKEQFRKDLFFRINGITLEIKPLRERKDDISLLTRYFIQNSHRRFIIKKEAIEELKKHSWPGNIRELRKKIELLSATEKGIIKKEDISFDHLDQVKDDLLTQGQKEFIKDHGLRDFIKKIEVESLSTLLENNNGKINKTIKELKISASAFYRIFNETNSV